MVVVAAVMVVAAAVSAAAVMAEWAAPAARHMPVSPMRAARALPMAAVSAQTRFAHAGGPHGEGLHGHGTRFAGNTPNVSQNGLGAGTVSQTGLTA